MLSSYEDGKPHLYMIDPSGVSYVSEVIILLSLALDKVFTVDRSANS